jgi:hypothetical protein
LQEASKGGFSPLGKGEEKMRIRATNLILPEKDNQRILQKSDEYKRGFFDGYATCKFQAIKEHYSKRTTNPGPVES